MTTKSKKNVKKIIIIVGVVIAAAILAIVGLNIYMLFNLKETNLVAFQSPDTKTEYYILGTVHDWHFEERYDYSLADVQSVIDTVQPDLLLVEVRQKTIDQFGVLDGPFEMMYAWSFAQEAGIAVRGIDWWEVTEDAQTGSTNGERDDHIYDNILAESAGHQKVLVLCGTAHRMEQSKRFLKNGYTQLKLSEISSYFGNVSPESFLYPASFGTALEQKLQWYETGFVDEFTAGTSEQGNARQMWLQNVAERTAAVNRLLGELVSANALYY